MTPSATTTQLWDYGWIQHDVVQLGAASTAEEMIEQYCSAPAFRLSFLPSDKNETSLHGPFVADRLSAEDFVPLSIADVPVYLESIEFAHDPEDDVEARAIILKAMKEKLEDRSTCFALKFTEKSSEYFHDWGFVFFVFREILLPNLEEHSLDRFVIGYD